MLAEDFSLQSGRVTDLLFLFSFYFCRVFLLKLSFYIVFLSIEPRRDPNLCKHFKANQPDAPPCSQCVSWHLRGEVTNAVIVCVCECAWPSLGEKMVFACVPAPATCLGLMRLLASLSHWLPGTASVFLYTCVSACAESTGERQSQCHPDTLTGLQYESVRAHNEANAVKNGCAC